MKQPTEHAPKQEKKKTKRDDKVPDVMKCPMFEKGHRQRDNHNRAEKENPLVGTFPNKNGKSRHQTDHGDRLGESLHPGHVGSTERPSQSCAIAIEQADRSSAAYLQMANIDKVKRNKINERRRVTGGRPTDGSWN